MTTNQKKIHPECKRQFVNLYQYMQSCNPKMTQEQLWKYAYDFMWASDKADASILMRELGIK